MQRSVSVKPLAQGDLQQSCYDEEFQGTNDMHKVTASTSITLVLMNAQTA